MTALKKQEVKINEKNCCDFYLGSVSFSVEPWQKSLNFGSMIQCIKIGTTSNSAYMGSNILQQKA
jgi:hypothetical protein